MAAAMGSSPRRAPTLPWRRLGSARRCLTALLLAAYLPGCTAYHQTATPVAELTAPPKSVARLRVTRLDGSRLQIWEPFVARDSIVGTSTPPGKSPRRRAVVALADVQSIAVRKVDAGMTLVGVVGTATVISLLFAGLWAVSCNDSDFIC